MKSIKKPIKFNTRHEVIIESKEIIKTKSKQQWQQVTRSGVRGVGRKEKCRLTALHHPDIFFPLRLATLQW